MRPNERDLYASQFPHGVARPPGFLQRDREVAKSDGADGADVSPQEFARPGRRWPGGGGPGQRLLVSPDAAGRLPLAEAGFRARMFADSFRTVDGTGGPCWPGDSPDRLPTRRGRPRYPPTQPIGDMARAVADGRSSSPPSSSMPATRPTPSSVRIIHSGGRRAVGGGRTQPRHSSGTQRAEFEKPARRHTPKSRNHYKA